ncbi:MAG: hypothetical protein NT018_09650 [Armatimonadetes bacterium]|nr:hypothetical protein [Armatimonadota bacterium]
MNIKILALCIALLLIGCGCSSCFGKPFSRNPVADSGGHVVLVIAANISIRDITGPGLPNLTHLFNIGSGALMNVHTGRPGKDVLLIEQPGMEAGCVALGAGAMAVGGMEVWQAANASACIDDLNTRSLYSFRTGKDAGNAQVLQTEISRIVKANASASYHALPGGLGSSLQARGIKTAVIGNSDLPGPFRALSSPPSTLHFPSQVPQIHREAVAAAMNCEGAVDFGDVDSCFVKPDQNTPYGVRTDPAALMQAIGMVLPKSRFIVVDFGDTYRADIASESCTDDRAALVRHQAALRLDYFIGALKSKLDLKKDTLILLSPSSRNWTDIEEERLAPILIVGQGFERGTLSSPSTRKAGIVTLSDVAPTILSIFGIKSPVDMVGRSITSKPGPNSTENLLKLNIFASLQQQRLVAMRGGSYARFAHCGDSWSMRNIIQIAASSAGLAFWSDCCDADR